MNKIPNNFETASGPIDYTLTNDFIFRALLQRNKPVLIFSSHSSVHYYTFPQKVWMLQS